MHSIIGSNIQKLREQNAWTQEHLAAAAEVTARTVQRAEQGQPVSCETLQSIASALTTTVDDLRHDAAVDRLVEETKKFTFVPLTRVERGGDLVRSISGQTLLFNPIKLTTEAQEDLAAELNQQLRDWLDISSDLAPLQQREYTKAVGETLDKLRGCGLVVGVGYHRGRMRLQATPESAPMDWTTTVVVVIPEAEFKPFVRWDISAPIEFA